MYYQYLRRTRRSVSIMYGLIVSPPRMLTPPDIRHVTVTTSAGSPSSVVRVPLTAVETTGGSGRTRGRGGVG